MTFFEAFDKVKASMKTAKADKKIEHLAIQVNLNDPDASGICYIEIKDGKVFVEPYDYYDRDAIIHLSSKNLVDIMRGKLDFDKALEDKQLTVEGNYEAAALLKTLVKKPATRKKPAAKKAAEVKAEPEKKATPAKKPAAAKKAPAKKK